MKHFNALLLTLFLLPLFSLAQSNYKPGYLITLKGDTLRGFIDYQEWDSNPTAISFKTAISDRKPQSFTISNISFFNVAELATYQKYICPVSMDETNTARLSSGRDTSYKIDTVFLKILQKGKNVALYSYSDGFKTRFYISEAPDYVPTELIYRIYDDTGISANKEGNTVIENTYLKQLFAIANKHNALDDDLSRTFETASYSQPDLLTIVSRINNISKSEYAKKYAGHSKLNFYVSAALNISNTSSNSSAPYTTGGGGWPYTSYLPAVSFGLNIIPKPSTGKVELRAELSFAETKFSSSYQLKVSPYVGEKASFNQLGISLIPQIIYNIYNAENFKFYVGAGIGVTRFVYSNAYFGSQDPNISDGGIGSSDPYYFNGTDSSYLLKAGAKINKKFEIFFNYFTNTATTQGGYFQFVNSSKQIGIVYLLGK
ncbi:MAG: hypothetical protein JWQ63_4331 [Mucilaginibacter sp.]|nr:hypothetical protein [Mucilaginibacter sp.]